MSSLPTKEGVFQSQDEMSFFTTWSVSKRRRTQNLLINASIDGPFRWRSSLKTIQSKITSLEFVVPSTWWRTAWLTQWPNCAPTQLVSNRQSTRRRWWWKPSQTSWTWHAVDRKTWKTVIEPSKKEPESWSRPSRMEFLLRMALLSSMQSKSLHDTSDPRKSITRFRSESRFMSSGSLKSSSSLHLNLPNYELRNSIVTFESTVLTQIDDLNVRSGRDY